jgi:hypothetical protein
LGIEALRGERERERGERERRERRESERREEKIETRIDPHSRTFFLTSGTGPRTPYAVLVLEYHDNSSVMILLGG